VRGGALILSEPGFIRFDPVRIENVALDLQNQYTDLTQNMAGIRQRTNTLRSSWNSDRRADNYFDKFAELDKKAEDLARALKSFCDDLNIAAGIYEDTEKRAKQTADGLPTNMFQN
jgi:WXG100 family type VII secretion target